MLNPNPIWSIQTKTQYWIYYEQSLGEGGYGRVYVAKNLNTQTNVAMKMTKPKQSVRDQINQRRIENLSSFFRKNKNDHIVQFKQQTFQSNNFAFTPMQICQSDLKELIYKKIQKGGFTHQQILFIVKQILSAFYFLDQHQIIHRDLKPQNFLILDGILKLGDFDTARSLNLQIDNNTITVTNIPGTKGYMSKDRFKNEEDLKCDVWSFGCILYQLITKSKLASEQIFKIQTIDQRYYQISKIIKNLSVQVPPILQKLVLLLKQCLQIETRHRPSWKQLKQIIKRINLEKQIQNIWKNKQTYVNQFKKFISQYKLQDKRRQQKLQINFDTQQVLNYKTEFLQYHEVKITDKRLKTSYFYRDKFNRKLFKLMIKNKEINVSQFLLKAWCELDYLSLVSCKIDDNDFKMIIEQTNWFKNLKILNLTNNQITQIPLSSFNNFPKLRNVILSGNRISPQSRQNILKLKKIKPQITISI